MRSVQLFAWSLLLATLGQTALAQENAPAPPADIHVKIKLAPKVDLSVASLQKSLAAEDLDAREATLDALVARLSSPKKDEAAVRAEAWLRSAAAGQGELAWTARLTLREVESERSTRRATEMFIGDPLLELLEPGHAGLRRVGGAIPPVPGHEDAFDDSDSIEVWVDDVRGGVQTFPVDDLKELGGCTFELRCGPGDVRLRIVEAPTTAPTAAPEAPGAPGFEGSEHQQWITRVREYSGDSLPEILDEHPELRELLPFEVPGQPTVKGTLRTDVLGVYTRPLDDAVRVSLGLPPGVGLDVARVEPGTIAQALGIERGAVITKLCGLDVTGEDGVSNILGKVRKAAQEGGGELEVEVVWIDAWGKRKSRTWRGAASSK